MHAKWCISDIKLQIVCECVSLYVLPLLVAAAFLMKTHIMKLRERETESEREKEKQ